MGIGTRPDIEPRGIAPKPPRFRSGDTFDPPMLAFKPLSEDDLCYRVCPKYRQNRQCVAHKQLAELIDTVRANLRYDSASLLEKVEEIRKEHCYKLLGLK